ncbi:Na+/H+ antiporter NhaC family protein [Pseudocolwellia agarivorans]|uniref:Na+/H+ antiporter NhaC family protein n=1 Tax=Pseudocolwellia agarivorans TaxID=1911682 RepID=UPI000985604E|nr:Na+/H+ antiporter NhaC family protein [Pseudocolwellia agarivorans]
MQDSALSLLPPLIAIIIAVWKRNALIALLCGLMFTFLMINHFNPFTMLTDSALGIVGVFSSTGNSYIVAFSLLIGALVTLMNQSGAVNGFIESLAKLNLVKNKRQAAMLPTIIGTSIFTDTNLSMFTAGMASQKLFDTHKLSRARLAYLLDSTCAPVSILFLINGWGAYVLGLLDGYSFNDPVGILIGTIGYNFYAIIALVLAYYTAFSGKAYGSLRLAQPITQEQNNEELITKTAPAMVMWFPLLMLLVTTLGLLWFTGNGDIRQGSGSFSVFWAIISALVCLTLFILSYKLLSVTEILAGIVTGTKKMLPAVGVLVLSFAFGSAIKLLGTGLYVSQLINVEFPLFLMAPILFIAAGIMAFATGTSWGTFAILVPIAVPVAQQSGLPIEFMVAAVLGGGVFGDHASPISDTTVVASIASGCDHFEHVKTQLPYTLFGGVITIAIYTLIGLSY